MPSVIQPPAIAIRNIESFSEIRAVERIQKEVWGCSDVDVVPLTMLVASKEIGAVLIGAYDHLSLAGFVYGFPGCEEGQLTHHSHMLAVKASHRNFNLGYRLKLAQRERVLAQGINRITWTFDPLQSLNAHFNFAKLGVVADVYKTNFYGETTSSFLHQVGTDRLWVTWLLDSQRVCERLQQTETGDPKVLIDREAIPYLLRPGLNNRPQPDESCPFDQERLLIEIPHGIDTLQRESPALAITWREATRWAFTRAMSFGYVVEEFYRSASNAEPAGIYLLSNHKRLE